MKILIISHMYPSTHDEIGGRFVHEQVKALIHLGCEVRVFSPVPWSPFPINRITRKWKRYAEIPKCQTRDGVKIYYPRYLSLPKTFLIEYSGHLAYWGLKFILNKVYKEFPFDLIHSHEILPDSIAGILVKRRYKKPLVITLHGQDITMRPFKNKRCKAVISGALKQADQRIFVSQRLLRVAKESHEVADNRNCVIGNGISLSEMDRENIYSHSKEPKRKNILSVSCLIPLKGIDYNILAISRIVTKGYDVAYTVIGDGPEMHSLKELVKKLNLEGHVEFLGEIPHQQVLEYMRNCDIFSLPSWNEGFGIVYIEAMACSKPVIACQDQGISDVIDHRQTGMLAKAKDVDSLALAMEYLLQNPSEAKIVGEQAQKLVETQYTWDENAKKTINVYKKTINEVSNDNSNRTSNNSLRM
jgi:teichuronic acid biosynthesis glycosyltransferase TuaC